MSCDLPRSAFPKWKMCSHGPRSGQLEERFLGERGPALVTEKVTWPSGFAQVLELVILKARAWPRCPQVPARFLLNPSLRIPSWGLWRLSGEPLELSVLVKSAAAGSKPPATRI